jgi:hypothetical protein
MENFVSLEKEYIEPLGPEAFGILRKAYYLPLTGRIGRIFSIADGEAEPEWENAIGHSKCTSTAILTR